MRSYRILLCAAVLGAGLTFSACSRQQSDPVMDRMLHNIQRLNGRQFEGGVVLTGGRVEGKTLVVVVQIPAASREGFTPAQFTALLASGICTARDGPSFFTNGRMIRLETAGPGPAGPGASIDHCPTADETGLSTTSLAGTMQTMVGRHFGPLTIASIGAEGNVLVVTFDGAPGWREGNSSASITASFLDGFCRNANAPAYFSAGRTVRVDTLESGQDRVRGDPAARCPAAPPPPPAQPTQ